MEETLTHRGMLVDEATREVVKEDKNIVKESADVFIRRIHNSFMMKQAACFPRYCQHVYQMNKQNEKFLEDYGNKGKYTDTYGWSQDGSMKNKWVISQDLKNFMTWFVYERFWEEDNAAIRDRFMNDVCKGGTSFDYEQLLKAVLLTYGTDIKESIKKDAKF